MINLPITIRYWLCKCSINRPFVSPNSLSENASLDSNNSSPFSDSVGSSVEQDKDVRSSVIRLLDFCSPPTISVAVISVVIYSIKRVMIGWSSPHITNKVFKRAKPSATDLNAPPSVIAEFWGVTIAAPLNHRSPRSVLLSHSHTMFCSKLVASSNTLTNQASTGFGLSRFNFCSPYYFRLSTITKAIVMSPVSILKSDRYNGKVVYFLTNKINKLRHELSSVKVSLESNVAAIQSNRIQPLSLATT